ncbi:MAG: GIY-YIG nuclease family protein [Deltaproteobacteria bacterium]|nr:GIY-YIG nuclease family protein [Deltaproteobacteria bacterium]
MGLFYGGAAETHYVYILRNSNADQLYTGQTSDLQRRLKEHNRHSGSRQKYTGPDSGIWELLHVEKYESKTIAIRREKFLKSGKGREWRKEKLGI